MTAPPLPTVEQTKAHHHEGGAEKGKAAGTKTVNPTTSEDAVVRQPSCAVPTRRTWADQAAPITPSHNRRPIGARSTPKRRRLARALLAG